MVGRSVSFLMLACAMWPLVTSHVGVAQTVAVGAKLEGVSTSAKITLDVVNAPLENVLRTIARQTGVQLIYDVQQLPSAARVTMRVRDVPSSEAFATALTGTGLRATVFGGLVSIKTGGADVARAMQGSVGGKVIDGKTKVPLRGATVTLSGLGHSVTTGDDGTFRFANVVPGSYTLSVRLLGYVKATKTTTVVEGQTASVEVALETSVNALDRVVVTGTIIPTELKALPNAITVITAKDIERRGITHLDQLFRGDVPGLFALNQGSNSALDQVTVFSRGASTLPSNFGNTVAPTNPIKTYVDGIELADASYLSQIDPRSIERVEILTGPQASTIYGSNAINGVMQIFTKRGTTTRPQFTATLSSGVVQNSLRSALAPQHDYSAQVSGTESHWSYQAGGSWNYMGEWTPAKRTARTNGFGGAHLAFGPVTADASIRLGNTQNRAVGTSDQVAVNNGEAGLRSWASYWAVSPTTTTLDSQTLGLTLGYAPTSWWSHQLVIGTDAEDVSTLLTAPAYSSASDTTLAITQSNSARSSLGYTTTAHIPLSSLAQAIVTLGADEWHTMTTYLGTGTTVLTGTLNGSPYITRAPSHNTGAFVQGQLGIQDALFLTYGLRAEWNPNFGTAAQPNFAPRYGLAYTRDFGPVTAKVRASYGRSTRPPTSTEKVGIPQNDPTAIMLFGPYMALLPAPDLGPEFQQGGEGGLELYVGSRASIVITRYNQTVDGLIDEVKTDSMRSYQPYVPTIGCSPFGSLSVVDGYCYNEIRQYLNIGSIRNQGWELQGTVTAGPFVTKGTYSWTQSRFLGITPAFRSQYSSSDYPQYQPGAPFQFLPEHTWAINFGYAQAMTTMSIDINGLSQLYRFSDEVGLRTASSGSVRLQSNQVRRSLPPGYRPIGPGYSMVDVNASHRFSSVVEGILQVQNLTNFYQSDVAATVVTLGRQTKTGLRIRL